MDQLRAMRTFAEVAGQGGFAAAARALGVAPSVVTRLVAELEGALGARLLHRSTRQVALTPAGQRYLPRVQAILRAVGEASADAAQGQRELRGRVRLAAPPLFAACQLVPRLGRLRAMHPEVEVELAASHHLGTDLPLHDITLAVHAGALDGDFVAHALAGSELLLCASPAYLHQHGRPRHPRELAPQAVLAVPAGGLPDPPRRLALAGPGGEAAEVPLPPAQRGADLGLCLAGALAGLGIAALPSFAVQPELAQGRLVRVLGDWGLGELAVHACLPTRRHVPAAVRAVLGFLRAEFPGRGRDPWRVGDEAPRPALRLAA